jgi:hypothetical protein
VRYGNDVYYISADHTSGATFLLTQTIGGVAVYQLMFDGDAAGIRASMAVAQWRAGLRTVTPASMTGPWIASRWTGANDIVQRPLWSRQRRYRLGRS